MDSHQPHEQPQWSGGGDNNDEQTHNRHTNAANTTPTATTGRTDSLYDPEVEAFKRNNLQLSPQLQKLALEAQRTFEEDFAHIEDGSGDDDDDYGTNNNGDEPTVVTVDLAERIFRDVCQRCDEGSGPGKPSVVRTAAACLLLEQLCAQYPQYVTILTAISDVIMKSVFVPDTADMRHLLGGVKRGIRLPSDLAAKYGVLLKPYARKTYSEAHQQLSEGLVSHAKANRNIELRLTRQTNIFERTVKHWSASVLRNHFVVWRQHTRRRKQIREKYRTIFGRMRTDECRVKAIRAWRDRAARMKRLAMFDTASVAELEGIQGSTERMQEQIVALQDYNNNLSSQILELERDRQVLQTDISAKERVVVELALRARDMGRVGTHLLDTAIVRRPPPEASNPIDCLVEWASQMIDAAGGMLDGQRNVLRPLRSDSDVAVLAGLSNGGNASVNMGGSGGGGSNALLNGGGGGLAASGIGGGMGNSVNINGGDGSAGAISGPADAVVNIPLSALGLVMLGFTDERRPSREQLIQLHTHKDALQVAKDLTTMCARLIGVPSLVTAEQLATRQRPMILLFLASLMRHYTNYIVNKPLANVGGALPTPPEVVHHQKQQYTVATAVDSPAASAGGGALNDSTATADAETAVAFSSKPSAPTEEDPEAQAAEAVGEWAERVTYQQQWITTSMAALHSVLELALQKPVQLSSEEQEDLGKFYNIPMSKLSDVLPPSGVSDTFYLNFFRSLTRIYPDLRKVYSAYATPTLAYHDMIRLLKDCKLLGPKRFQKKYLAGMMLEVLEVDLPALVARNAAINAQYKRHHRHARRDSVASGLNNDDGEYNSDDDDRTTRRSDDEDDSDADGPSMTPRTVALAHQKYGDKFDFGLSMSASTKNGPTSTTTSLRIGTTTANTKGTANGNGGGPVTLDTVTAEEYGHLELSPAAFTECIIRLALAHARKLERNPHLLLTSSSIVSNFVLENIVPNALRSDVDRFKHVFRHPLVQQVIARNKIALRRAFHKYSKEDNGEGMSLKEFQHMAKDCRWYTSKNIRDEVLQDIFKRCQQDNGGSFDTLDLYEWLEAICALAIYDNPNPLVPLHTKLGPFVEDRVLAVLQL